MNNTPTPTALSKNNLQRLEAECKAARQAYSANPTQFTRAALQTSRARLEFHIW